MRLSLLGVESRDMTTLLVAKERTPEEPEKTPASCARDDAARGDGDGGNDTLAVQLEETDPQASPARRRTHDLDADAVSGQGWCHTDLASWCDWVLRPLLLDGGDVVRRHGLLLHVKFLKLVAVSTLITVVTRELSCTLPGWACVQSYGPSQFFTHYFTAQSSDLLVLFFVGRVFQRSGVDSPLFIGMCLLGALWPSAQEQIPFLRVSLSLYAMMCHWSPATWVWVAGELVLVIAVFLKHVHHAYVNKLAVSWVLEVLTILLVCLAPNAADSAFHAHHWYCAWILAMLARFEPCWSLATQAFFVGYYINGIAIYGRHPVLACKEVYFLSDQQGCTLGKNMTNGTEPIYIPPNPWNCSGDYARRSWMLQSVSALP